MSAVLAGPSRAEPAPLEILQVAQCTAACLLGQETRRCTCRCGGTYHGLLLGRLQQEANAT